ncbi:MAG: ABC transporter substrate-binding protein [Rhodospirillales bacterium]|nr:ABC transporter substrate-binding protein [Rhodospirillales bacterium]
MLGQLARIAGILTAIAACLAAGGAMAQNLTIGTGHKPATLDPHSAVSAPGAPDNHIFEALVALDGNLAVMPALATGWRRLNPTTWEFTLRRDVKFHDGSEFTADDVIASFKRASRSGTTPATSRLPRGLLEIVRIDDHTVLLRTRATPPALLHDLADVPIVARKFADAAAADFDSGKAAVGTGPYKLVEWNPGARLIVERFAGYWGPRDPWLRVITQIIPRDADRVAAVVAGKVDVIDTVPENDRVRLLAETRVRIYNAPAPPLVYVALDSVHDKSPFVTAKDGKPLGRNPLRDVRVRRALSLAIDRQAIINATFTGAGEPAGQFLPPTVDGMSQNLTPDPFDPEGGRALLRAAGWGDGFKIALQVVSDRDPRDRIIAEAVGKAWEALGLAVDVQGIPGSIFFNRSNRQQLSAYLMRYDAAQDATTALLALVRSYDGEQRFGLDNRVRYSNPRLNDLLAQALGAPDAKARNPLLVAATELAMADYPLIPLFHPTWEFAARNGFDINVRVDGHADARSIRPTRRRVIETPAQGERPAPRPSRQPPPKIIDTTNPE